MPPNQTGIGRRRSVGDGLGRRLPTSSIRSPLSPEVEEEHWLSKRPSQVTTARFLPRDLARENRDIVFKGCFEETVDFGSLKSKSTRAKCYRKHMLELKKAPDLTRCNASEMPFRSDRDNEYKSTRHQHPGADGRKQTRPPPPTKFPYSRSSASSFSSKGASNIGKICKDEKVTVNPASSCSDLPGESKAERDYRMARSSLRPASKNDNLSTCSGATTATSVSSASQRRRNLLKAMRLFGGK